MGCLTCSEAHLARLPVGQDHVLGSQGIRTGRSHAPTHKKANPKPSAQSRVLMRPRLWLV